MEYLLVMGLAFSVVMLIATFVYLSRFGLAGESGGDIGEMDVFANSRGEWVRVADTELPEELRARLRIYRCKQCKGYGCGSCDGQGKIAAIPENKCKICRGGRALSKAKVCTFCMGTGYFNFFVVSE